MGIFKSPTTLLLSDYSINSENGSLLEIKGLKTGFISWILHKLKIRSRNITYDFREDYILTNIGDKVFTVDNFRDVYSYKAGFGNKKLFLILSIIGTALSFFLLVNFFLEGNYSEGFKIFLGVLVLSGFFYWKFKRSSRLSIIINHNGFSSISIRIKSGITGKMISIEDLTTFRENLTKSLNSNSKWFNSYYK